MFDPEKFGQAMAEAIRAAVEPLKSQQAADALVIADLRKRLDELPVPKDGAPGPAGPAGEPGAPGTDGKSVTVADVLPTLQAEVQRSVAAIPAPIPGPAGPAGAPGADGKSVTVADVLPTLQAELQRAVAALPAPAPGAPGRDGSPGERGMDGKDGIGLAGFLIDRDGALQATTTNGEVKNLGPVVGRDGKDGADGIGLDDFTLEYLPESHEVMMRAAIGTRVKELRYPAGGIRPGGYWRDGVKVKAGQAWTYEGSLFIAVRDTDSKPEAASADWVIGARKGRDGDDRKRPPPAPAGPIKLGT